MTIKTINCSDTKKCNNVATIMCPPAGANYPCADLSIYDQSLSDNCDDSDDKCKSSESTVVSSSSDDNCKSSESTAVTASDESKHKKVNKDKKCQSSSNFSNSSDSNENDKVATPVDNVTSNSEKVKTFSLSTCEPKNQHVKTHTLNLKLEDCCNNYNKIILKLKKGKIYNFDSKLESCGYEVGFSYDPCEFKQINETPLMTGDKTFTLDTKNIKSYCFLMSKQNPANHILVLIHCKKTN
jgi:hypothetical protein